jgi:hypothetical protein
MELEHSFDGFGSTHLLRIGLPDVSMKNNKKIKNMLAPMDRSKGP